ANDSPYGSLLMTGAGMSLQLLTQKYGRDAERESDRYGMLYMSRAGYNPAAAVDLQETFVRLSEGRETSWLEGLFASHPPSQERVDRNRAMLTELPPGGELGVENYRRTMSRLVATREAYSAHDQGRKALAAGDLNLALAEAKRALAAEPDEALFHVLRGDIRAAQSRWDDALINYRRAVDRNPGYFYPYMRRGIAFRQVGDTSLAVSDLERSIQLLPSAPALNTLGELKLERGERDVAMELFRAAAESDSPDGRAARESLARLELPQKPYRYLNTRLGQDADGSIIVEINNPTGLSVNVSELTVEYLRPDGQTQSRTETIRGRLEAGTAARMKLPFTVDDPRRLRVAVTGAQILD
ncbi:MAG: tetratricopeptide repeat protein, partial [Gammaproteobacteria bacterium]